MVRRQYIQRNGLFKARLGDYVEVMRRLAAYLISPWKAEYVCLAK